MKKVLFATTALIATAGMAAADVKLSGYGRFGIYYNDSASNETSFTSRFRLNVDGTTTADNGVTFGARIRLQGNSNTADLTPPVGINAARFYAMTGGLTVAGGNILGAIESMPFLYNASVGLTGLSYGQIPNGGWDAYTSGEATVRSGIEMIYKADQYTIHASYSDPESMDPGYQARAAIYASGSFSGYTVALAYQDSSYDDDMEFVVTAGGEVGPATVALMYGKTHGGDDSYSIMLEADVAAATSVKAYYANREGQSDDDNNYGVGFVQDLGGGASIQGGVASVNDVTVADLGVLFNF